MADHSPTFHNPIQPTQPIHPIGVPKHRSLWAVPLSVVAHVGLLAALVLSVAWKSEPPAQLQAELWEAIPTPQVSPAQPVQPEPMPEPKTEPEAVKAPVMKAVAPEPEPEAIAPEVIQKNIKKPERVPVPTAEPEPAKTVPKSTPKVEPTSKVKPEVKPDPKPDTSARDAARAKEIARMNQLSQNAGLSGAPVVAAPQAGNAQGLGAGWAAKLKACVQPNLRFSDSSGDNPRVVFVVKLNVAGSPSDPVVSKPSGNAAFDTAVSRALLRCDPFPKPESGPYPSSLTVAYRLND